MKVFLIVLILIAPSLGRPSSTTQDDLQNKDAEPTVQLKTLEKSEVSKPADEPAVPHIKDDLRIHQEIAETILKSRTENKNDGGSQNVVISASVQVNQKPNVTTPESAPTTEKVIDNVHRGIAVPLTMEEIEKEMALANSKPIESSTSKEGISTWILVNGNGPTAQPEMKPSQYRAEIDKKVDKIARIKESQVNKQTLDISNAINKRSEAKLRQRPKPTTTTTTSTTTTTPSADELLPVYDEEDYEDEEDAEIQVEPVVTVKPPTKTTTKSPTKAPTKKPQNNKQNPKPTSTSTTTTTTEVAPTEVTQKVETTTFLILEPKDAGFDMPQDRSPNGNANKKAKRPNANNKNNNNNNNGEKKKKKNENKKKPAAESNSELKNSTKVANVKQPHQKNKPISTQIYNYLAREVMPTVGVGLVGLVVAGGLATYLLGGPLGALRRSYDIQDRKDDMYQFNNEEYAGADGQNEEDMFGKVIAGMPSSSLYRNNIRYPAASSPQYRPHPNQIYQQQPNPQMHPAYSKYGPYNRYRYPGGGYRQGAPMQAGAGYPSQYQPQSAQPPSYPQQQAQYRYNTAANPSQQPSENIKTVYAQSQPATSMGQVSPVYTPEQPPSIMEQTQSSGYSVAGTMDNQLQHRSQFVVGSTVPDSVPSVVTEKEEKEPEQPEEIEGSTAIPVPEHGPRRKRSTEDVRKISSKKINDNEIDNENDIDSNLFHKYNVKQSDQESESSSASVTTPESTTSESDQDSETTVPPVGQGTAITEFFRRIVELKVRYGLSFLQNATTAFQRYLNGVQERV